MNKAETPKTKFGGPTRRVGWRNRLRRVIRYRLHIPMIRSPHSPEFTARGVMVGMAWAMLPLVGIQMACVFVTWVITRRFFKWDFSLPNGLAWTWVTNVFTLVPCYYVFYVTGLFLMGSQSQEGDYEKISGLIKGIVDQGMAGIVPWLKALVVDWGVPMAIGSLPWSAGLAILSYYLSLRFVRAYRERRAHKMRQAQEVRTGQTESDLGD